MSKIILAILSIFFFHCSYVFSIEVLPTNKETTEIKFLGNKIKFLDKNEKIFIEKINGKVEEYTYKNNVYIQSENGKIVKLLETFIFDNFGDYESRFRKIAKGIFYLSGPEIGCNESKKNLYYEVKDNGFSYINCISSKILNNKEEIFGPNLKDGWGNHLRLDLRAKNIKSINSLKVGSFKEWDSLSHFNFLLQIEKDFKIRFNTNDFSSLKSIKEISKKIKNKIEK